MFKESYNTFEEAKHVLNIKEIEYISFYNSYHNGYNMSPGGDYALSIVDHSYQRKKVYQWDLYGNLIAEYESIKEAHEKTGVAVSTINLLCTNRSYGRHLKYLFTSKKEFTFDIKKNYHREVIVYDLELNPIKKYDSIKSAAIELRLPAYYIREICEKQILRRLKKYTFSYVGECPPEQVSPGGKKVYKFVNNELSCIFPSIAKAAQDCGLSDNMFRSRIKRDECCFNNVKYSLHE